MTDLVSRLNAALAGRYRIERELGEGGMATVYLADDQKHERKVALKVLKPELAAVVGAERFLAEIKTTANLQHPHILPLFDSGEADSFLFYVMPYVEGESLRERIDREGPLPVDESVRIASDVAEALEHAHRQGVVHRDIKPANILLRDDRPLVADFGIALAVTAAGGGRLTETGLSLGTPFYMSPEQATADRDADARSDVYSLGCVLYEMLVGEPPHTGASAQAVLGRIITADPTPPSEHRRSVSPRVEAVVLRSLEKLPADRFQSASEFSAAISGTGAGAGFGPTPIGRRPRIARPIYLVAAFAAGAAISAAGFAMRSAPGQTLATPESSPFTYSFQLEPDQQIAGDSDQLLLDISNDGQTMAWIGPAGDSGRRVFYRSVRDLVVRDVPGTQGVGAEWLKLSPDGRQVSFQRNDELFVARLDGSGAPQRIFDERIWSWTWADDGSFVLAEPYGGLLRLTAPGAEPEVLTRLEGEDVTHQFPQVLPDGRSVLFSVGRKHFWTTRIEILAPEGDSTRRRVVLEDAYSATFVTSGHLVFGRGDEILFVPFDPETLTVTGPETALASGVQTDASGAVTEFAVSRTGTVVHIPHQGLTDFGLAWVGGDRGIEWLSVPAGPYWSPEISPDFESVALSTRMISDRQRQIYVIDLDRFVPRRVTVGATHLRAIWSPDNSELIFNSTRNGYLNLFRAQAGGGGTVTQISTGPLDQLPMSWSRNGRLAYVERLPYDQKRIRILSTSDPTEQATQITPEGSSETFPDFSPDGRWLAFEKDGQVFIRGLSGDGGREDQVSREGGLIPKWRPDGRSLYYYSGDFRRILAVDVDTSAGLVLGPEAEVFSSPAGLELSPEGFDVAPDGRVLIAARSTRTTPMQVVVSMNLVGG